MYSRAFDKYRISYQKHDSGHEISKSVVSTYLRQLGVCSGGIDDLGQHGASSRVYGQAVAGSLDSKLIYTITNNSITTAITTTIITTSSSTCYDMVLNCIYVSATTTMITAATTILKV
jgi:hypothetical protein